MGLRDKLRVVCHELRMRPVQGEPSQVADLNLRISRLPSPEEILKLSDEGVRDLRGLVDRLVYDIDRHENHRSKDRASLYHSRTGLPTRRQPLAANWYQTALLKESASEAEPALVYAEGRYWWWTGLSDHNGDMSLNRLRDDGTGRSVPKEKCRIVEGEELKRQMEAIRWFAERNR